MPKAPLICILLLILSPALAHADDRFIFRPRQGLLLVEDFQHWLSAQYEYSAGHSSSVSTASHQFQERYNFSTNFDILDPHLLRLQLGGALWAQQLNSSNSVKGKKSKEGFEYEYSLTGTALDDGWHPVAFNTSRTIRTVLTPFTPAYTADGTSSGIECSFRTGPVQTRFSQQRSTLDTSGGGINTSSASDLYAFTGIHNYKGISTTSLSASWSDQKSNVGTSSGYLVSFNNGIYFDQRKNHHLASDLRWQDATSMGVPRSSLNVTEILRNRYGRALASTLAYSYSDNRSIDFDGNDQLSRSNSVTASIEHHLYDNFETHLSGHFRQSDLLGGMEEAYGGTAMARYSRKLPGGSRLTCDLSGSHEVTDRNLGSSQQSVRDEAHTVAQQGDTFTLGTSGVLVSVVSVKSLTPPITYTEGYDYTVDLLLRRITIVPGGGIAPGTNLFISYILRLDPSIKYATDAVTAGSSLSFLGGRYIVSALVFTQDQTVLSGQPVSDLTGLRREELRFQGAFRENLYTLMYTDYSSDRSKFRTIEGGWQFNRSFPSGSLSLQARDRYAMYDGVESVAAYDQNTFSTTATYRRTLWSSAQFVLSGSYIDNGSGGGMTRSDTIYVNAKLQAQFNKVTVDLGGQVTWLLYGTQINRNDYAQLVLTRYF